jgi:hypothetical protein
VAKEVLSMNVLPAPKVVRCYFANQFQPHLPAMELAWDLDTPGVAERNWFFPEHLSIRGPAPERFGTVIQRMGPDQYSVRTCWNDVCLTWRNLRRVDIMTSALALVLQALGTDLWQVLEQPIDSDGRATWHAAIRKAG